jgi:actin-like ATPase involved in cell morphogenesis
MFDDNIIKFVRKEHGIIIGESTAEKIKEELGSTKPFSEISALSSGGVCSSAILTALTMLSNGSCTL